MTLMQRLKYIGPIYKYISEVQQMETRVLSFVADQEDCIMSIAIEKGQHSSAGLK
jgi:hypothetical protein